MNKGRPTRGYNFDYDAEHNKIYGILSYIGVLCFVPLFAVKESPFARFHAGQGLVLFITEVILGIISYLVGLIPFVGVYLWLIGMIALTGCLVLAITGIVNANGGNADPLPLIGKISPIK